MEKLFEKDKIHIINDYISYVESELEKDKSIRLGTIDKEHVIIAKQFKRELMQLNKAEEMASKEQSGNSIFFNRYKDPLSVQLELTSKCNQRCIQCYNQSNNKEYDLSGDVTVEDWIKLAKELAEIPIKQVIISGGEPTLLGDDLFTIMDIFHNVGCHFIFITNGMLINENNIHKYAKYNYAWMQFSIDGATEEIHDSIRGSKGAYKKVTKAALLARSVGIPIGIASTIMKKNLHEVGDLIDLAYQLGAFKIMIGEFMYAGRAVLNCDEISLTDKEIMQIKDVAGKRARMYGNLFQIIKPVDPVLSLMRRMVSISSGMLVRPNGEVRIDCQAPARIGNIKEDSIMNIWNKVGYKGWTHPELLKYIKEVKCYKDLLTTYPRTHVDPDLDLSKN